MLTGTHIPHSLRLSAFFLRVAVGLSFFYLGFTALFNPTLAGELRQRSLGGLYAWLAEPSTAGWLHAASPWIFLIVGACLSVGLATRMVSFAGIALTLLAYLPTINLSNLSVSQFINDEVIVLLCLIVIILSRAGTYMGLDKFFHFSLRHRK